MALATATTQYAVNTDGIIIGHGEETCIVHVGETTTVTVTVIPLDGYGNVDLTVNWIVGGAGSGSADTGYLVPVMTEYGLPGMMSLPTGNGGMILLIID